MLERKITQKLEKWKDNPNKQALLITGARQVGKTFIIKKFAEDNYENSVYINFIESSDYKSIFDGNLDAETIIKQISLRVSNVKLIPNKTVIIFDEIQACERAITSLKFLVLYGKFDIICSGSLLGIAYRRVESFPVGYIERMELNSLDFEEFCWANGMNKEAISYLREYFDKMEVVPSVIHNKMIELFKEYIVVGGMPRVVEDFVTNHDFSSVLRLQRNIIEDYKDDIVKYADTGDKPKIRECFLSIPRQLAKENKKFQYNLVSKNGSSKKYNRSLEWLYDAGIINFCHNLSIPELPLEGNSKEDVFKVYMNDTGLLMAMLEDGSQIEIIDGNLNIYKGAIYENVVGEVFNKLERKLYYFEHNSTIEIDFFIRYKNTATAIEVKSADNTKAKSLNSIITNWGVKSGIKLSLKNIGITSDKIINIPIYMAIFLDK